MGADMCASEREKPAPGASTIKQHGASLATKEMLNGLRESKKKGPVGEPNAGPESRSRLQTTAVANARGLRAGRLPPIKEDGDSDPPWVHEIRDFLSIEFRKGTELMTPTPTAEALTCFENVVGRVDTALREHQKDTPMNVYREFVTKKLRSLGNMGLFWDQKFEFKSAASCYKRCYEAAMLVDCDSCLIGNITNNVAAASFNDGNAEEAVKWFELSRQHWSIVAAGKEGTVGSLAALSNLTEGEAAMRRNKAKKKVKAIMRQIKTMRDIAKIDKQLSDSNET